MLAFTTLLMSAVVKKITKFAVKLRRFNRASDIPVAQLDRNWCWSIQHVPLMIGVILLHSEIHIAMNDAVQFLPDFLQGVCLRGKIQLNAERLPLLASPLRKTPDFPFV